ncbi:hypothetical protein GXW78_12260 [Roseomonas terrae]|uniref:Uncharacterized protein n=1 Tax=Neoroseomonas terrae TaxID=424799 RepID=A0ABS5EHE3_9PROT|nr:hypothetical protein [Neoroseomonas terrae]MBR0650440.1 hypothetical protein [Neoroseomonas terrae]
MPAVKRAKTSFAAGELAPELLGRGDLGAFDNGARRLRNVFIQPTGGVTRRPGLRHVTSLPGPARLIPFEFNTEQTYLIVLTAGLLRVFQGDAEIAALGGPWSGAMLPQIGFTQNADTLLLTHPEMRPQRVTRTASGWTIGAWSFAAEPFARFAGGDVAVVPSATSGSIVVDATAAVFSAGHLGARLRVEGKKVLVTAVHSSTRIIATVEETLSAAGATADWDESAFSDARGWPVTCCFHQDRLVVGGSRDLPNRLWLSRTGELFNFDMGTGLDDQAIEFGLLSDQVNAIRGLFSGRHLQVFTSGAEWMVTGDPLTPGNIQLNRQTRVGSPVDRLVPPVDVDGSTVFIARGGQGVHEFAYTDLNQVYQANDLAILARHLVRTPVSMAYDQGMRLLHMVIADGSLATLTIYRAEQVTAWTRQETDGAFRTVAEAEGTVWAVVERAGAFMLERFEAGLSLDAALTGAASVPQDEWSGLGHLEGRQVGVLAEGAPRAATAVSGGAVVLDPPATAVQVGLTFRHEIEPLPPELIAASSAATGPLRLVAVTFRLLDTAALAVDLGRGAEPVPFRRLDAALLDAAPPSFTGDVTLRGLGWRRDRLRPLWRIDSDVPLPMTLLSVTTEIRITD